MQPDNEPEIDQGDSRGFISSPEDPTGETRGGPGLTVARVSGGWAPSARELIETILIAVVIFFVIRLAVENYRVEGQSMEPNFHDGQFLLVNKLAYRIGRPARGDVLIFHFPLDLSQNFVKRVLGFPGDKIQIKSGKVYANDVLIPEPLCAHFTDRGCIVPSDYDYGPTILAADEYFVLGDNRPGSNDSRFWGPLPAQDIIGKAWLTYWPPELWGPVPDLASLTASNQ